MPSYITSFDNLCAYGSDKAKSLVKRYGESGAKDIMKAFCQYYHNGIRGHASGKSGSKMNKATKDDLTVFYSWCKTNGY